MVLTVQGCCVCMQKRSFGSQTQRDILHNSSFAEWRLCYDILSLRHLQIQPQAKPKNADSAVLYHACSCYVYVCAFARIQDVLLWLARATKNTINYVWEKFRFPLICTSTKHQLSTCQKMTFGDNPISLWSPSRGRDGGRGTHTATAIGYPAYGKHAGNSRKSSECQRKLNLHMLKGEVDSTKYRQPLLTKPSPLKDNINSPFSRLMPHFCWCVYKHDLDIIMALYWPDFAQGYQLSFSRTTSQDFVDVCTYKARCGHNNGFIEIRFCSGLARWLHRVLAG